MAAALYAGVAYTTGYFSRPIGIVLLAMFVAYMVCNVLAMKNAPAPEDDEDEPEKEMSFAKEIGLLILGAALIAVGANLLVDNGTLIAQALGVPESVIALTFVALGTSLPELVTAITSLAKGHGSLSLGNVIGANVFNLVLVTAYTSARWCVCWAFWFVFAGGGRGIFCIWRCISKAGPSRVRSCRTGERAAFADLQRGRAAAHTGAGYADPPQSAARRAYLQKYYAGNSAQDDDMISIGTIGLIKAVDYLRPRQGKRFASYASRCIENELRMDLRRGRRTGVTLSLQEPLEADGQLTLADTLPDEADMEAGCEPRRRRPAARAGGRSACPGTRYYAAAVWI